MKQKTLKIEVAGKNRLNKVTIEELENILPQLHQFVGQKIFLANGNKSNKFKESFSFLEKPDNKYLKRYLDVSRSGLLMLFIQINEMITENASTYFENYLVIGKINNSTILAEVEDYVKILNENSLMYEYKEEEISEAIEQYKQKEEAANKLRTSPPLSLIDSFFIKY